MNPGNRAQSIMSLRRSDQSIRQGARDILGLVREWFDTLDLKKEAKAAPSSVRRPSNVRKGVRRDKAALSSGCESHPANAPAGSNRSSYGGNEVAEAFG